MSPTKQNVLRSLWALAAVMAANPASAAPPMIRCSTSSNGYSFQHQSLSPQYSLQEAVRQCQASNWTSNLECSANAACDGQFAPPMVTCRTESNGYSFADQSRDPNVATSQVIDQCTKSNWTANAECQANVACDGLPQRPWVTCRTQSNGYSFTDRSRDQRVAYDQTLSQCRASNWTNNTECQVNLYCEGGFGPGPNPNPGPFPNPHPNPNPFPNPTPNPTPFPNPNPFPGPGPGPGPNPFPGPSAGHPCFNSCAVGAACSDGCPAGGQCNYVSSQNFWRVIRCGH